MSNSKVQFVPGGIGIPRNIIFTPTEYNSLPADIKKQYKMLSKNTWALSPLQMRVDKSRLPRYLSIAQFNHFASIVRPYYRKIVHGFGAERANMYGLKPGLAYDASRDTRGTKIPGGARITAEQYHTLPAKFKPFYREAFSRGTSYYYLVAPDRVPKLARQRRVPQKDKRQAAAIRTPTVGVRIAPMGRWLEIE